MRRRRKNVTENSLFQRIKNFFIGGARNLRDPQLFHKVTLIAFFAWIGLGSDGISSSCYGPEEAFLALGQHYALGIIVALATAITIFIVSASYSQIVELFPAGGGGYLVASKLLSPGAGVVAGSALIIDYVLTISLSVASGSDALFSFLPASFQSYKFAFAVAGILVLAVLNMRGVKESIVVLTPIFIIFILTHAAIIIYSLAVNIGGFNEVLASTGNDLKSTSAALGFGGMAMLVLRAYSMGAGTFTGIEAVSNGLPVLAEPKIANAKKTMRYMAWSLSLLVLGIMLSYVFFKVQSQPGKTLNAVLFEAVVKGWGKPGYVFVLVTLVSEAALLFVAAQTGFIDGPRVLANMAKDKWMPTRFALLSDRLVAQNGILLMSAAALFTLFLAKGSVKYLVVLYSINVFITFTLSQLGMVVHWWRARKTEKKWFGRILINGVGLLMTAFILVMVTVIKFKEGGWITLFITGAIVTLAFYVRKHYDDTGKQLERLDSLVEAAATYMPDVIDRENNKVKKEPKFDEKAKTAVVFVNGFNGLGLHTALSIIKLFDKAFKNFIFIQIGVVDTGNFKGLEEVEKLQKHIKTEVHSYIEFMRANDYYCEGYTAVGTDVVEEANKMIPVIRAKYPDPIFFGGQLVFKEDTFMTRMMHNYIVFQLQQSFYHQGITFVILPIRIY